MEIGRAVSGLKEGDAVLALQSCPACQKCRRIRRDVRPLDLDRRAVRGELAKAARRGQREHGITVLYGGSRFEGVFFKVAYLIDREILGRQGEGIACDLCVAAAKNGGLIARVDVARAPDLRPREGAAG